MGKRNATNRNNPRAWVLTEQHKTAIELLVTGKTITATAAQVGVGRCAVSDWVNHHPGFIAALNQHRQDLWADAADRLRGLLPRALDVLAQALEGETPVPAAVAILKAAGLHGLPAPAGPIDPQAIAIEQGSAANLAEWNAERVQHGSWPLHR